MYPANFARLKKLMKRALKGEELTIGFLGGSVTQGALASIHENTYSYRVFRWWEETFPGAEFHYVNGGIGGTNSLFGISRAETDLLMYQPDFVVVDYSVNDAADRFCQETFEGLIRKLFSWPSHPAVMILNNVFYATGESAQDRQNEVGRWYRIPYVSVRDTIYRGIQEGKYIRQDLTPDDLHPNDKGHALVAKEITAVLEQVKAALDENEEEEPMPSAMTANAYEQAKRLTIRECCPKLYGFHADTEEKTGHLDPFKNGWIGKRPGDRIVFTAEASCIAVQYRKTIHRPAARARLILDGDTERSVMLDGNFDEDWGDCLYLEPVLHHGEKKVHTVEIEVLPFSEGRVTPFYLLSLITA